MVMRQLICRITSEELRTATERPLRAPFLSGLTRRPMCGRWQEDEGCHVDCKTIKGCHSLPEARAHAANPYTGDDLLKTLLYDMKKTALRGIENNQTVKTYKSSIQKFTDWIKKEYGIRSLDELKKHGGLSKEVSAMGGVDKDGKRISVVTLAVQRYSDYLQTSDRRGKPLSPSTIHTYLAGVCKGLGVSMDAIDKPARSASSITKGRELTVLSRGMKEQEKERFQRIVAFARATGLRRHEIGRVRAHNLTTDVCGYPCVEVRGKGGKLQRQRILPGDLKTVQTVIGSLKGDEKLFSRDEMRQSIDLHSIRRGHAQEAYKYYLGEIQSGKAPQLREELLRTWEAYHPKNARNYQSQLKTFRTAVFNDRPYFLRGENAERARKLDVPTKYDRLALMCVSVWHLAHWRADVTVKHYMM